VSEKCAGEEVAPSSFLQTSSRYIVQEKLELEYQDNSRSILAWACQRSTFALPRDQGRPGRRFAWHLWMMKDYHVMQ